MFTEEEASKVYCPLAMINENNMQKCAGSMCMAWRWTAIKKDDVYVGYCGLAGKP